MHHLHAPTPDFAAPTQRHLRAAVDFIEGEVAAVRTTDGAVCGVALADGTTLDADAVILTTGTFLAGVMHCGEEQTQGGRIGDSAAHQLSRCLLALGLRLARLKTGTTPRLDGRTVDWERLERQWESGVKAPLWARQRGARWGFLRLF